jgi:hypothetical protein
MSFSYNPYNHIELVRARPDEVDRARILAFIMAGVEDAAIVDIPKSLLDEARRALEAGVKLPPELEPKNDRWTWFCRACHATGRESSKVLDDIIGWYMTHLAVTHLTPDHYEDHRDF